MLRDGLKDGDTRLTWPIVWFLGAKLVAYTLLGFLLGWAGSLLQLTPLMRAVLQIAIGLFMLGTALRLFNIHPIFRYFAIEPPAAVTRYIRRLAKDDASPVATPLFLGALTVLIPCGVTQAMMALAIAAGNPLAGAAIMFSFTLGTIPVFFTLAYLATRLGKQLEGYFLKAVAVVVLALGLLSINGGLALLGSPLTAENAVRSVARAVIADSGDAIGQATPDNVVTITVSDMIYTPGIIRAQANKPITLALVTEGSMGCTLGFVIPSLNIQKVLPQTGLTTLHLPPQKPGTLRYTCSLGMYGGEIQFI
jgi:sulfite exporter TauE/SafE